MGTERLRTTYNGGVEGTFTSLPWGDSQSSTGSDAYHYATLDHDNESDTDHAQFRQYSNTLGRWLSPDPYGGSYDASNPQSFNRYVYAMNSPLSNIDSNGLYCLWDDGTWDDEDGGATEQECNDQGGTWIDGPSPSEQAAEEALSDTCVEGALEEVVAAGETPNQPDDGYGTNVGGTVVSAPSQFSNLVGQRNVHLSMNQLQGLTGNPQLYVQFKWGKSSAFGRYQITNILGEQYGMTDWTPSGQDDSVAVMLQDDGATQAAMQGNLQQAYWDMGATMDGWASMPDSTMPGTKLSMSQAVQIFSNAVQYLPECQQQ